MTARTKCGYDDVCIDGFRPVTEEWAIRQATRINDDGSESYDPVLTAAYRDAVVPCADDAPERFARWRGGHYEPNHSCGECTLVRKGRTP